MKIQLLMFTAVILKAQGLDPAELLKPPTANWPQFNGELSSGRRYQHAFAAELIRTTRTRSPWRGHFNSRVTNLKGTPLEVNGTVYFSAPDHVWAIDARTGRRLWHYERPSEGDHIASRGVAIYNCKRVYFGTTPDAQSDLSRRAHR